ncbi:MAG: ABC transporter substrate-binding protein [Alphaproteobacteria bacterium]|nr:ABC transporter substrate-binding protein [Alphaproteobacteria bacterium]
MAAKTAALALFVLLSWPAADASAESYRQSPALDENVASGKLPPVQDRLPDSPRVITIAGEGRAVGHYGGNLRILRGSAKDVRHMVVFGYARLVGYTEDFDLVPDLLAGIEIEEGRIFTLRLRPGHRWSDGHPFTSEDFRYFWQDIALDEKLSPLGPDNRLLVDGERPKVEVLDETTVRYSWSRTNPFFLPALAGAAPLYIYRPAHYLRQFHAKYNNLDELNKRAKKAGQRNWAALHHRRDRQYRNDNPEMPTLQPWVNTTRAPSERFVFRRNPYYHRVDQKGQQLPYLDQVTVYIAANSIIPAKAGAGDADLQARALRFDNYTFLKKSEKQHGYLVRLWRTAKGSQVALFPNLNAQDPGWRALFRDVRFRRALSLAINRHEINQVVYFGLGIEGANAPLPRSPLHRDKYTDAWAKYDVDTANALLDKMGLVQRDDRGVRLMADGRPLEIIVETAGESTEQSDVLELIRDSWSEVGVKLFTKPSQRQVFRNRIFAGDTLMSVWSGFENGLPTADMSPEELAPTNQMQLQWSKWGQHYQSSGRAGEPPDLPEAIELSQLDKAWRFAPDREERERIWHRMLEIYTDQVYSIGIISGVLQPVVVNVGLRNVPEKGIYNWDPGAFFGMYRPDTFWFEKKAEQSGDGDRIELRQRRHASAVR